MKAVNLIKSMQNQAKEACRPIARRFIAASLATLLLVASVSGAAVHLHSLDKQIENYKSRLAVQQNCVHEQRQLDRHLIALKEQSAAIARQRNPIAPAALLALLTQVMPEQVEIDELVIETHLATHLNRADKKQGADSPQGCVVTLRLTGSGQNEPAITKAIDEIARNAVFGKVTRVQTQTNASLSSQYQFLIETSREWHLTEFAGL